MKLLIGLLAVTAILWLSSLNWRHTVKVVLVIVVFEGALRKWVFPQANEVIYFLKDLVLAGAYLKYYVFSPDEKKYSSKSNIIKPLILIVAGWCFFQAFNPSLGSPIIGLFGIKNYLFYIPLIWLLSNLFQSEEELYKFLRSYLLLIIPVGILGIVQFFSPASSLINVYSNQGMDIVTFGGTAAVVRITGTFPYLSGYSIYLMVCFGLLVPMISVNQPFGWRLVLIVEILLVTVNSLMTGSRVTVIASVLFILGYVGIQGVTHLGSTLRLIGRFLVPVVIIAIAASIWFRPAVDAYWQRTVANHDISGRISGSFMEPFDFIKYKELDGYGTGAAHQATPVIRKTLGLPAGELIPTGYESEMGRIVLELGPIGFLLWYGLRISIAIALFGVFWKSKRSLLRQLALAACLIQSIQISGQLVFHHTFSIYYWFLSSFIFLLPRLEQIEEWHRRQQWQLDEQSTYLPDLPYR